MILKNVLHENYVIIILHWENITVTGDWLIDVNLTNNPSVSLLLEGTGGKVLQGLEFLGLQVKPVIEFNFENYHIIKDMIEKIGIIPLFFYFDKHSQSSLELAKIYKKEGTKIFFEPSEYDDSKLFLECLSVADILKYKQQIGNLDKYTHELKTVLEIKVLDKTTLYYKLFNKDWQLLSCRTDFWCSVGIIYSLSKKDLEKLNKKGIERIISLGQNLNRTNYQNMTL